MWKKISSKTILDHPRLKVSEDTVMLPNGTTTDYLVMPSDGKVATIIVKKDNKILLQKEYSYPPNEVLFQFPGGFVPESEDIRDGANRELMEELGQKANTIKLIGKYLVNNRRSDAYMYVFLATDLEDNSLEPDPEEDIENLWFSEDQVDKLIKDGEIKHVHVLAAWTLYKAAK